MVAFDKTKTLHERRLGRTVLHAYRDTVDLYDLIPNKNQPRRGPKEDTELQRQIEANEGIFEPLLVEPHPDKRMKFRIIDGDRRWTNAKCLVEDQNKEKYRQIPVEVIDKTLSDEDRLRVWIYIHRQRKEWDAKEKEMVAFQLVDIVGRAHAANMLGVTVRQLDKLCCVFEISQKLNNLPDPKSAITWAREINSLSKKLLTPSVSDELIRRINSQELTNSKDIRKLRQILKDPIAEDAFLNKKHSIEEAVRCIDRIDLPKKPQPRGLAGDLLSLADCIKKQPWTELAKFKSDPELIAAIEEAEVLLQQLRKSISK